MYGKIFASLFTGSMYGKGAKAFALMAYVVANMKPDKEVGFQVELNSKDLANRIGEPEEEIKSTIEFLCAPDPESRTPSEDGRRLIKIGTFDYQVVNGVHYAAIRNEEERKIESASKSIAQKRIGSLAMICDQNQKSRKNENANPQKAGHNEGKNSGASAE